MLLQTFPVFLGGYQSSSCDVRRAWNWGKRCQNEINDDPDMDVEIKNPPKEKRILETLVLRFSSWWRYTWKVIRLSEGSLSDVRAVLEDRKRKDEHLIFTTRCQVFWLRMDGCAGILIDEKRKGGEGYEKDEDKLMLFGFGRSQRNSNFPKRGTFTERGKKCREKISLLAWSVMEGEWT